MSDLVNVSTPASNLTDLVPTPNTGCRYEELLLAWLGWCEIVDEERGKRIAELESGPGQTLPALAVEDVEDEVRWRMEEDELVRALVDARSNASLSDVDWAADEACVKAEGELLAYQRLLEQQPARGRWCGVGMLISASQTPATVRKASDVSVISKDHGGSALQSEDCVLAINGISTRLLTIPEVKDLIKVRRMCVCVCVCVCVFL
jgi:hypothetical protein